MNVLEKLQRAGKLDQVPPDHLYIGRSVERADRLGLAREDLGNPYRVGVNGIQEACATKFALALGNELERNNQRWTTPLAVAATLAVTHGCLTVVCHCAPRACHGEAIALAVGERLTDLGYAVDYSGLDRERLARLRAPNALEAQTTRTIEALGLHPRSVDGIPWTTWGGSVTAVDGRDTFVHLGDGSYRRIATERLESVPEVGQALMLQQSQSGELSIATRNRETHALQR